MRNKLRGFINKPAVTGFVSIAITFLLVAVSMEFLTEQISADEDDVVFSVITQALQYIIIGGSAISICYLTGAISYVRLSRLNNSDIKYIVVLVVILSLLQLLLSVIGMLTGIEPGQNEAVSLGKSKELFYLYMIPVMILLVGPAEEFIFRGIIQGSITAQINWKIGVISSSILFGMAHVSVAGGGWDGIVYAGVSGSFGLFLGYYYEKTQNLIVPALSHGIYNSILMILLYLGSV